MKFRMRERLREQQEAKGERYVDDSYEVYLRHKEQNKINAVNDEKLSRIKNGAFYYYNFKVEDKTPSECFKELYRYIKSKPGLEKKLGLSKYDMECLAKGEGARDFSWENLRWEYPALRQLISIAHIGDEE